MNAIEDILRDTFRTHDAEIGEGPELMPGVRARIGRARRRRWTTSAGAVVIAVVAMLGGAAMLRSPDGGDRDRIGPQPTSSQAPPGWRFESALGGRIEVPAGWATNDFGCGMSQGPTVARPGGAELLCGTHESARKEVAILKPADVAGDPRTPEAMPAGARDVDVSGVDARRAEWRRADGRFAGRIRVPSRNFELDVRTLRQDLTRRILDSLVLLDVDNDCPTSRAGGPRTPAGGRGSALVAGDPTTISICYYGGARGLKLSSKVSGPAARELAATLNTAEPGSNPDLSPCSDHGSTREGPDLVLVVTDDAGRTASVFVNFATCKDLGFDNGGRRAIVTKSLVQKILATLHYSAVLRDDLPD